MFAILLFAIIGFLAGFIYVIIKRKIRPGEVLTATFLGLLSVGAWKIFRDIYRHRKKFY
jgi:hypothetical protein